MDDNTPTTSSTDNLVALSVQMGIDLTPDQDLEKRLDAMIATAKDLKQILKEVEAGIRAYEYNVRGQEPDSTSDS